MGSKESKNSPREEPREQPMASTPTSSGFSTSTHTGIGATSSVPHDKHSQFWDTFIKNARSPTPTDDLKDERKTPNIKM